MDGNHRLAKNYMLGKDKMLMYILDEKNTKSVMFEMMTEMEYPMAKGEEQQSYGGMAGWKGKIVWMSPDKFLSLVHPLMDIDKHSSKNLEDRMKKGQPIDFLVLVVDADENKVTGHEGRHRATIAKKLGIEKVPVLVWIRRSGDYPRVPQWTQNHHDYADKAEFKPEYDKSQ